MLPTRTLLAFLPGLMALALVACSEPAQDDGSDLLVPDNAQEARWGTIGDQGEEASTNQNPNAEPDNNGQADPNNDQPSDPVGGADNPWNSLERPSCAQGGVLWEQGGEVCGSDVETEQLRLLNLDRQANGLQPLRCHTGLLDTARRHSEDMALRSYFDHLTPEGMNPWDRMDRNGVCQWRMAGENIAFGQSTPAQVQEDWMNSPGHRANILTPGFTHVGVGVYNHNGRLYWTQLFATF